MSSEFEDLNVSDLKAKCREQGFTRYSSLRKSELIAYLSTGKHPNSREVMEERGREADDVTSEPLITKRDFLTGGIAAVAALSVNGMWRGVRGLVQEIELRGGKELLRNVIDIDSPLQIFTGNTNKLAKAEGKEGPSPYVRRAANNLFAFANRFGEGFEFVEPENASLLLDAPNNDVVLVGGPVSNNLYAQASGHRLREVVREGEAISLPEFDAQCGLRWGFSVGVGGYGLHGESNEPLIARRFDEGGNLVMRPVYGIWDSKSGDVELMPRSRKDNFLLRDCLLITRIPNWFYAERGRDIIMLGGVHGYSLGAFGLHLDENLEEMQKIIGDQRSFQICVPADLKHWEKMTIAKLRWDLAKFQPLMSDYRGKPFAD